MGEDQIANEDKSIEEAREEELLAMGAGSPEDRPVAIVQKEGTTNG